MLIIIYDFSILFFILLLLFRSRIMIKVCDEGCFRFCWGLVLYYFLLFILLDSSCTIWIVYSCSIYDIFAILTTSDSSNISLFLELWVNQQLEFFFFLIHAAEFLLIRIALIIEQFQTYLGSKINTLILPNFHNVVAFPDKGD